MVGDPKIWKEMQTPFPKTGRGIWVRGDEYMGSSPNSRHSGFMMLSPWVKLQSSSFLMTRMDQNTDATPDLNTQETFPQLPPLKGPSTQQNIWPLLRSSLDTRRVRPGNSQLPWDSFAKIRKPMPCDSSCNAGACRAGV